MKLKLYVGTVVLLAGVVAFATAERVGGRAHVSIATSIVLVVLIATAEALQVRYHHHHDHVDAHNLLEGMLAPLLFIGGGTRVAVVTAVGITLADLVRRNNPLKSLFNVAQWVLAASIGEAAFAVLRDSTHAGNNLLALAAAVVIMSIANQVMISFALQLATGSPFGERGRGHTLPIALQSHAISVSVNLIVGLCLTAAYRWSPPMLALGVGFAFLAYAAGHANATVYTDRRRLEGLQRATHALAVGIDLPSAMPAFLAETRSGFEVEAVELVLFGDSDATIYAVSDDGEHTTRTGRHELAELLAERLAEPTHVSTDGSATDVVQALAATGRQRAAAIPLRSGSTTVGMLLLFDRVGIEGFEAGELNVGAALGRELVSFLERVELVRAIDEERRKLADIVQNTSDGILTIDSAGVVTSWNKGLASMTGYSTEEMVDTRHLGLLRARDGGGRDVYIDKWQEAFESGGLPQELQIVTSGGQTLWLSCSYSRIPAHEEQREVLVVVARNITQARELERLKDDFVAVVSHELRTPLVPIKGWAQTLINRGDRLNDDQRRTAVQSILAQAQKLESLVLNILEASRIESGRADGEGVADVAAITMRIVEDTLAARPDRVVKVRPPSVPCQVRGSAVWVERAVSNLLANAVKYSPDDEPVDVVVSVEGNAVLVSVTDRGPGIALDAQDRIFERFERLEETRTQTGTGLGLYITRRLARAMGGDVTVSSVPGAGSTFLLRLPVAPVKSVPEQRHEDGKANVVNLR